DGRRRSRRLPDQRHARALRDLARDERGELLLQLRAGAAQRIEALLRAPRRDLAVELLDPTLDLHLQLVGTGGGILPDRGDEVARDGADECASLGGRRAVGGHLDKRGLGYRPRREARLEVADAELAVEDVGLDLLEEAPVRDERCVRLGETEVRI